MGDTFAVLLRRHRLRLRLTQEALAERAGISERSIREVERGRAPRPRTVEQLGVALGLDASDREQFARKGHMLYWASRAGRSDRSIPPDGDPVPPGVLVRQLPPNVAHFVGRVQQLTDVTRVLLTSRHRPRHGQSAADGVTIAAVHGPGGMGKSALAVRIAHTVARDFPDGQLYVDLQGDRLGLTPLDPGEALGRFLRALGLSPGQIPVAADESAVLYRSLLADRAVLVVLDNAASAGQVRPLLPAGTACGVLVTSRQALPTVDAVQVKLSELADDEAWHLLAAWAGPQRMADDPDSARTIIRCCGGMPLALRIIGARLTGDAQMSLAQVADNLAAQRRRLDVLELDDLAVRASFRTSYLALGQERTPGQPAADRAFRLLGALPTPHTIVPVAAAMLDVSMVDARTVLDRLSDAHLVERDDSCYRMHDLLRFFAAEECDLHEPAPQQVEAVQRVMTCYLGAARRASDMTRPGQLRAGEDELAALPYADLVQFTDVTQATAWLESERVNLMTLARQAVDAPEPLCRFALRLAPALRMFLPLRGYLADWREATQLSLQVARRIGDRRAELVALVDLGAVAQRTGQLRDALTHLDAALSVAVSEGPISSHAAVLSYLGSTYATLGDAEQAVQCFDKSVALRRQTGDDISTAITLSNAAFTCLGLRLIPDAARYVQASLDLGATTKDNHGYGVTLVAVAGVHLARQRLPDAERAASDGIDLCRQYGDRNNEWGGLIIRAIVHRHVGRLAESARDAQQAASLCRSIGETAGEAFAVQQLRLVDPSPDATPIASLHPANPVPGWLTVLADLPPPGTLG